MVEDKIRMQNRAAEKYYEQIFEKMKELEEKKSEEALQLVQKKYDLWRYQNERDEARRLQRYGSCSHAGHRSPRKIQDVQVVMSETAWKSMRGRGWRLEPEGRCWKPKLSRTVRKASTWTLMKVAMKGASNKFQNAKRSARRRRR